MVIGDIHGNARGLAQVFDRAKVDPTLDKLIFLGDYCDYWPETKQVIDTLMWVDREFSHKPVFLLGNHDMWLMDWMRGSKHLPMMWSVVGGVTSIRSYKEHSGAIEEHLAFMENRLDLFHLNLAEDRAYVHAGFTHRGGLGNEKDPDLYVWDRTLVDAARRAHRMEEYDYNDMPAEHKTWEAHIEVYVGHTIMGETPQNYRNLWAMDTGSKMRSGCITIMDVDTKEFWQSDKSGKLYPELV